MSAARCAGSSRSRRAHAPTPDNPHHPRAITADRVAYTGTHDNDTTAGWFAALDAASAAEVRAALGEGAIEDAALRAAVASPAIAAFAPAQDLLGLGSEARLNTPGRPEGNWTWRMSDGQLRGLRARAGHWRELLRGAGRA